MAYQNVGTPRFYINVGEWLLSTGAAVYAPAWDEDPNIFSTLPVNPTLQSSTAQTTEIIIMFSMAIPTVVGEKEQGFVAVLGHEYVYESSPYMFQIFRTADPDYSKTNGFTEVINGNWSSTDVAPEYAGFSILEIEESAIYGVYLEYPVPRIGSIILGSYYDMPHSPDLSLTLSREMEGANRIRTKGGFDLVQHKYIRPPNWGQLGAWELGVDTINKQYLQKSGRRIWDLSFSYLQDSDIFPDVSSLRNYETISPNGDVWNNSMDITDNTLLEENTFYSQVIHKTNGGQLPFIFQPDNSNSNPDQFAICKFDQSSFQFKQVANGVYNVKLKIREVW